SVYSVIDGINNATVKPTSIQLSQTTSCNFTPGNGLVSGTLKSPVNNPLTISEEASLGRDFDQKIVEIGKEVLTYDSTSNQFSLVYEDASANPVLTYQSNSLTDVNAIKAKANDYLNYLTARQVQSLLSGSPVSTNTLTDVIGSSNITTSGYLSEVVTVDTATMKTSSNITNGTYPTAHIDFSQLGSSYQLYDLLGTGFNSTCKTCDAHYSVLFTYGGSESTTSNGYGYTMTNDGGENYTLQVDLKSFMDNGIANGVDFTNALVSVLDQSNFDFHYTQYESKNGILYVTDNREQTTGAPQATFDTKPYNIGTAQIDMTLKNSMDNRNLQMQFTYDVSQGMTATAQMLVAPLGNWVDDGSGGYKKFVYTDYYDSLGNLKSGIPSDPSRYTLQTTNNVSTWENYYDQVMTNIAAQSQVSITSDDYVYANCHTDENPNKAIVSTFDFKVVETKDFFWIQAGANTGDGIAMTWDRFNLYSLGLAGNVLSQKKASAMIEKADNASKIISQIRSTFGAYTNRMEHMYDIAQNTAENIQSAESGIRDTNMAKEMAELSKSNILEQAGQAMLAQANKSPQSVLQLLQF
ncbi:MAG: flagellin, partial [Clostridiales bacterium]|nr:flagellin [Clostridiales bacterium]